MRTVKSNAKRQSLGLTVPVATRQARQIVDRVMPGVMATVQSSQTYDMPTGQMVIYTLITFPPTADASDVALWAERAPGVVRSSQDTCSIVVIRKVK